MVYLKTYDDFELAAAEYIALQEAEKSAATPAAVIGQGAVDELQASQEAAPASMPPVTVSRLEGKFAEKALLSKPVGYAALGIVAYGVWAVVNSAEALREMGSCIAPLAADVSIALWKVSGVSFAAAAATVWISSTFEGRLPGAGLLGRVAVLPVSLCLYAFSLSFVPVATLYGCAFTVPTQPNLLMRALSRDDYDVGDAPPEPDLLQYQACMDRFHVPAVTALLVGVPVCLLAGHRLYQMAVTRRFS